MSLFDRVMIWITQNFCKIFTLFVFKVFYRTKYINSHNIPKKGGFIMCPNHSSFFDPPLIGSVTFKRIFRFMARDTLFKKSFGGTMIKWMGAFPVKRGTVDRKSWDTLVKLVQNGEAVMLFPEGTRTENGEIQDGKPGAGMLIYKARARVVPVYAHGVYEAWPKGQKRPSLFKKIYVIYGEPMDFTEYFNMEESKEVYVKITELVMARIRSLKAELMAMLEKGEK
ncbi:MAG TPA: lysophospholipid acyltransferase family protein [Candidatus Goldiibacteriota bacterium]|nr:lysophospholipid acyltransferase family protein [Candidatus Goldiibacteriota bacterium]